MPFKDLVTCGKPLALIVVELTLVWGIVVQEDISTPDPNPGSPAVRWPYAHECRGGALERISGCCKASLTQAVFLLKTEL